MTDLIAKRTLVKSPPELWTELSEVESLARHLGEFGEIRITKVEPESAVAWEGEHASGTVEIEASGWGTKVTLTATVTDTSTAQEEPEGDGEADHVEEPAAGRAEPPIAAAAPRPEPPAPATRPLGPPPATRQALVEGRQEPTPPRRGFLGRLFGRRQPAETGPRSGSAPSTATAQPARQPEPRPSALEPPPSAPERRPSPSPTIPSPPSQRLDDKAALAVLEGTLDNLGSAHHRPFSREETA